jgi:hypothetical protein
MIHVTDVIPWHGYKPDDWFLDRGQAVHLAVELDTLGKLDEEHLRATKSADEVIPRLEQWRRWREEWKPRIVVAEYRKASRKLGYEGRIDLVAMIKKPGQRIERSTVIDYKCGQPNRTAGLQTIAYKTLINSDPNEPCQARDRGVLHLMPDRYDFVLASDQSVESKKLFGSDFVDWQIFRQYLSTYNFEVNSGLRKPAERTGS